MTQTLAFRPSRSMVLLLVLSLMYIGLAWPQLGLPLIYDDVNFAFAAEAVARTGLPFANAGNMSDRWDFSQRYQWALWHPPLYIYLLGLQAKLLGTSEAALRSLGLAFNLGSGALTYLIGRSVASVGRWSGEAVGLLAAALYLLSPLAIQSGLILDIDGTVLTFLLAWAGLLAVQLPSQPGLAAVVKLAALFSLALWAKLTTPLGLMACLVLFQLLRGRWRLGATLLLACAISVLIFLASWWAMAWVFAMPVEMPFEVVWIELVDAAGSSRYWLESPSAFLAVLLPPVLWASPGLALLFVGTGVVRLLRFVRVRELEAVDLLVGFGALVFAVYLIKLAGGFPKYHIAMLPFWAAAVASAAARLAGPIGRRELAALAAATLAVSLYVGAFVADRWVSEPSALLRNAWAVVVMLAVAVSALALCTALRRPLSQGLMLGLVAFALGWGLGVEPRLATNGGSTTYFYGTRGQREAARIIDSLVQPDESYAAAKELAWYAENQRYIDQDTLEYFMRPVRGAFDGALLGYDVRVVAVWIQPKTHPPFYAEKLGRLYRLDWQTGDYQVWRRDAPTPAPSAPG